eukprot:6751890-Prymnesium_polylepis.2
MAQKPGTTGSEVARERVCLFAVVSHPQKVCTRRTSNWMQTERERRQADTQTVGWGGCSAELWCVLMARAAAPLKAGSVLAALRQSRGCE